VYTALGGDYNAQRIMYLCQTATEIHYVDYLYLYMSNSKIIWHDRIQCLYGLNRETCSIYATRKEFKRTSKSIDMSNSYGDTSCWLLIPVYEHQQNYITWKGPVLIWTNQSDVQCIRLQERFITHIELPRYVKWRLRYVMLITYTCIWATVKSYDMTGSSVYMY
jgi:hypothetical protein